MITKTKEPTFSLDNKTLKDCIFNIYLTNSNYSCSVYLPKKKKHIYFETINSDKYDTAINKNLIEKININISKKNKIFVKTKAVSLIPKQIFQAKDISSYSSLLNNTNENIWYIKLNSINAYLIYTIPKSLLETIKNYFKEVEIVPIDKIILESINNHIQKKDNKFIFNIEDNCITIVYICNKTLYFYNHINYTNPQEFINNILSISKILNIDIYKISVIISGQIEAKSEYIKEVCNYFVNVSLAKLPDILNFDSSMKHIPQHYFYNLFIAPLCE